MIRHRNAGMILIAMTLLVSWGCSAVGSEPSDGTSPVGDAPEGEAVLPDYPVISTIEAEPRLVAPGAQVALNGAEGIAGTITFTSPDGELITAEIESARGVLSIPLDAAPGLYTGVLEADTGALAFSSFRVADGPGVWLSADRRYVSPGAVAVLTIRSTEVPDEALAAVYVQTPGDGAAVPLVPDEAGRLAPGIPVPLKNLVGRPLHLDGKFLGALQVRVEREGVAAAAFSESQLAGDAEPDAFEGWVSNSLQLTTCNLPGAISGDIGGTGFVNAVWLDGGLRSTSTFTQDGLFSITAGPGLVVVKAYRVDQDPLPEPEHQFVSLPCGASLELARVKGAKVAALSYAGEAGSISVMTPEDSLQPQPAAQSGGDEVCRTGIVVPNVSDADGMNGRQSALAGIALKTALNEAADRAEVHSMSDVRDLIDAAAEAMLNDEEDDWSAMIETLQTMVATDFVISLTAARIGQRYGVNTAALPLLSGDAQVRSFGEANPGALFDSSFGVYTALAEKFRQAAICGSADPENEQIGLDEEITIRYELTDLSGEGADGASVSVSPPECGRLDPESGSVEGERFETKFSYHTDEYCAEELAFEAEWSGTQGNVKTRPDDTIVRITPELPELTLRAGAAPGIGNTANMATAITLYQDYDSSDDPASLPGFTQDDECKFLEGGQELMNEYFYAHSQSVGKRAESAVVIHNYVLEQGDIRDLPVNAIEMLIQLDTFAVEIEDDNVIRGSWASGANHSDPNLTKSPGTLLVYDIHNPGNLPTTPIVSWKLRESTDDASSYSILVFYKVIDCGDDPAIDSLFSFVSDGGILLESDTEIPGPPAGQVPLPELKGDRQQIIMWVTSLLTTASIRDDDVGANVGGGARLHFQLGVNLAQEINQE